MQLLLSASNALNKWLKADFPRLPTELGKQAGVNKLSSNDSIFSWQVHIIDNHYGSAEQTLIMCEANSRFTCFIPLGRILMSPEELAERLAIEWQFAFVEALEVHNLLNRRDIATMLASLDNTVFTPQWVKNSDRSINGHITDASFWITDTLRDRNLERLNPQLALDIATYINAQTKSVKIGTGNKKDKFIPIERLLSYVQGITKPTQFDMSNVIPFKR